MPESAQPVCMTCGQSAGIPLRFNHLASGDPCPACCDRLLEALSPLLPGAAGATRRGREGSQRGSRKSALRALPRTQVVSDQDRAEPEPA
jgi:hypothetical protein